MKLSDYVIERLIEHGVRDIFLVAGGGIMHLLDSVGRAAGMRYHPALHEQAAVVAAEGYARMTGRIGVALVTVGPGAANAVAGIPGAWVDSVPLLVLTGQVRTDIIADYRTQRQYGPQEANTLEMARPITKYAARVADPQRVRSELDYAVRAATSGRPGPVWLEFPLDVQAADVDPSSLVGAPALPGGADPARLQADVAATLAALRAADRPTIVAGNGVRLAGAVDLLGALVEKTGLPIALPITAKDLIADAHPQFVGIFGTAAQRRANFAVQNSTAILALGAGLNIQKVGFNFAGFAPHATKIIVDIDPVQLHDQAVKPDIAILADVHAFLTALLAALERTPYTAPARWRDACAEWKRRYPVITPDYSDDAAHVNSYLFMDALSEAARADDIIVPGAGLDTVSAYAAFRPAAGQRVLISGWGSMGWDLPLAIGACYGAERRRTICVTGDGSIQWNVQELMTIARFALPIKIFVFNNAGFASIRSTQTGFFEGRFVGSDWDSGVANPDFATLAAAYGLRYASIRTNDALRAGLADALGDEQPLLCEVQLSPSQGISPKASAFRRADGTFESRPLEDMAPFLPREEVWANMHQFDEPVRT